MAPEQRGRVIVGVDGSLVSLRALREAVAAARRRQAKLIVTHIRAPGHQAVQFFGFGVPYPASSPVEEACRALDREAEAFVATCINEGLGGMPAGVAVVILVGIGSPRAGLVHEVGRDDDLLVVGTRGRPRWSHPWHRSVSKYCVAHAGCPVLVVPLDSFALAMRRERRWYRSLSRRDPCKQFPDQQRDDRQHAHE